MKTLLFAKAALEILAGLAFALFPSALFLLLAARGLVTATAFYDFAFVDLLLATRFVGGLSGIALWPTVVLHFRRMELTARS